LPVGAVGGDARPAAADRDPVRPGLAGRPAGEPGGDPVVEPCRGAAVAAGHRAGWPARRLGKRRLATGRLGLRAVLAAVRPPRRQPAGTVVAARGALVRAADGAVRRVLAAAAARP